MIKLIFPKLFRAFYILHDTNKFEPKRTDHQFMTSRNKAVAQISSKHVKKDNMKLNSVYSLIRDLHVINVADKIRYTYVRLRKANANRRFKANNKNVPFPPDYLIYESFQLDLQKYFETSKLDAQYLLQQLSHHTDLKGKRILDWGCGPGRIIRHLPELVSGNCEFYGTDYNHKSIDWCGKHLKGIKFNNNSIKAELPYPDDFFDIIYGISIFTHLSEKMHYEWLAELSRILKPGGIIYFTSQGNNYRPKLSNAELQKYDRNDIVVRGKTKEGHRMYSAFHPVPFIETLCADLKKLDHITLDPIDDWLPQDIWIFQK